MQNDNTKMWQLAIEIIEYCSISFVGLTYIT